MLVVRLEVWPEGDESRKRDLGRAEIVNDETGTDTLGNYDFRVRNARGDVFHEGRVERWPRLSRGPWALLFRCMSRVRASRWQVKEEDRKARGEVT